MKDDSAGPVADLAVPKLSAKEARFVAEYCVDRNGRAAAVRAGYAEKFADRQAWRMLQKPEIAQAIDAHERAINDDVGMTAEWWRKHIKDMADDPLASRLERLGALKLAGQHMKLLTDKVEHTGKDGAPLVFNVNIGPIKPRGG